MDENNFSQLLLIKSLLSVEGLGNLKLLSLVSAAGDLQKIPELTYTQLKNIKLIDANLSKRIITAISEKDNLVPELEKDLEKLLKIGGKVITFWDTNFPDSLKRIYMPPLVLYYIGELKEVDQTSLAIVGTRMPTNYGKIQAEKLASELAERKITIVSGLARGIDTAAHRGTLNSNGRTIAITGAGPDVIYPHENKKLYHEIAEKGLILTEFKPGTKPDAQNFPKRNRLIAGLSLGTMVIETRFNGGAMQTAAHALEQNKEVFALPGNINSVMSEGTNRLIQNGEAKLVSNADDIISELQGKISPFTKSKPNKVDLDLSMFEAQIYDALSEEPIHIDNIALKTGMNTSECLINLLTMEFKGACRQLPGKTFIRM
ncbi:MAG: DNA processing protein DprA [Melioribacteraceae bacterium]|nr:MAG: DNA processing protein DprA [Melioribacteraceae bacterium]